MDLFGTADSRFRARCRRSPAGRRRVEALALAFLAAWRLHRPRSVTSRRLASLALIAWLSTGCVAEGVESGGSAIRHTARTLSNDTVLDGATRIAFAGGGAVTQVVLTPCRVEMSYQDGSWTHGEWAALGHDGFTYSGTLLIEAEEAGEPSGFSVAGGGFGVELWGYRMRFDQRPAEEPDTVYRWAVGLDLVTVMTGDVPDRFGQVSALERTPIAPAATFTDADLACLPPEMAAEMRSRQAAGR